MGWGPRVLILNTARIGRKQDSVSLVMAVSVSAPLSGRWRKEWWHQVDPDPGGTQDLAV